MTDRPVWVKICGIRDLPTARAVAELGPDAIGLNFYAASPRSVTLDAAAEIVGALPAAVEPVGVFVNYANEEIVAICRRCGLQTVQLHGDESPKQLDELSRLAPALNIIWVHRFEPGGIHRLAFELVECEYLGVKLRACLIDARAGGVYGGSGKNVPWQELAPNQRNSVWPPVILAGGLTAENVAQGIERVRPWGVDVASGVESAPGVKDLAKVKAFIESARAASHSW